MKRSISQVRNIGFSRAIRADSITAAAVEAARGHSEMQLQSRGGARPT